MKLVKMLLTPPIGAISAFALCCCALTAQAINYVDPVGGNDDTAVPGSEALKYKTIQAAIDNCPANGTVSLADYTYDITTAVILKNGISLVGSDYKNCIIRQTSNGPDNIGRVINMSADTTIYGITVTGGNHSKNSVDKDCNWANGDGTGVLAGERCTISHCCVSNNYCTGANTGGAGIKISSGTIDHTIVANNRLNPGYSSWSSKGNGIWTTGTVTIDTCLIVNNGGTTATGTNPSGGIHAAGRLTLRNSTIAGNKTKGTGGGITLENTGSEVVNCIFADNFAGETVSDWAMSLAVFEKVQLISRCNLFSSPDAKFGTPSRAGDPCFIDAEAGDYRLGSLSPAVNLGVWYEGIADDLLGFPRGENPDAGCYERQLEGIVVLGEPAEYGAPTPGYGEHAECVDGVTYRLSCPSVVTNGCIATVCTGWRLKDGTGAASEGTGCEKSIVFQKSCEPYTLTWVWEKQFVSKTVAYVAPGGRGTCDGLTPENAMGSISEAVSLASEENPFGAGGTVYLADGTYELATTLMLANDVHLIGGGYEKCVIRAKSGNVIRIMIMEGADTRLEGVTVCGGVRDNYTNWGDACGAGIWLKGGTVSHCMISNNVMRGSNVWGGGVYACSGTITHCVFAKNIAGGDNSSYGAAGGGFGCGINHAGQTMTGLILVDRCLFFDNQATAQGGGVYNAGSGSGSVSIRNCTIAGNKVLYSGGSAGLSGSTVNLSAVESCIFTDNLKTTKTEPQLANCGITSATIFKNCLFGNGETAQGEGSISGDAKFMSSENGDYHLQAGSDAIDKGLVSELVTPDLEDYLIMDGKPDIGCYERQVPGITVTAEPGEWGRPDPDYGTYEDVVAGETYLLTAPEAVTNAEGTAYGTCLGWRLMDAKGAVREGTTSEATFTYEMKNGPYVLTWLWDTSYLVTATAVGGGSVDLAEAWMKEGSELTVTASETDTAKLWSWFGGVDKATRCELTQTLTVDRPLALVAKFYDPEGTEKLVAYVSPTGAGNKDGYDAGNANDSIADAVSLVSVENAAGGEVRFVAGTYNISETLPLRQNLSYVGATDGESVLDGAALSKIVCFDGSSADDVAGGALENLVLSNCTAGCVSFAANSGDFTVTGCRFTAGKYGIAASSGDDSRLFVSNCAFVGLSTSVDRAAGVNVSKALVPTLVDCLFKGNTGSPNGNSASLGFTYYPNVSGKVAVLRQCRFEDNRSLDCCNGAIVHYSDGVSSGLRLYGCTFLRNSCTMRPGNETNGQRSPCLSVRKPGSGVYAYDSYFGYNTLTNTATAQNPQTASVLVCGTVDGNFMFVNCTFEHNRIWSTKDAGMIGTFKLGWAKKLGLANCVFNENDVFYHNPTTDEETRQGELNYGAEAYAMGIFNCIFTHTADDYEHCHSNVGAGRQYCLVVNSDIKGFTNPTSSHWMGYRKGVTDGSVDPMLAEKVSQKGGLPAHGVSWQSKFRKGGEILRMGSNGIPYMYKEGGRYNTNANMQSPWLPVLPCNTTITDAAAAELGLTTQTPPMDDAFGAARREKRIAYGPLNAPPRGLMLLVR